MAAEAFTDALEGCEAQCVPSVVVSYIPLYRDKYLSMVQHAKVNTK